MPVNCCVVDCTARSNKSPALTFFRVARSNSQWESALVAAVNRADKGFNAKNVYICSRHFDEKCYETDPENEFKRTLLKGSLPTKCMPQKSCITKKPKERKPPARRSVEAEVAENDTTSLATGSTSRHLLSPRSMQSTSTECPNGKVTFPHIAENLNDINVTCHSDVALHTNFQDVGAKVDKNEPLQFSIVKIECASEEQALISYDITGPENGRKRLLPSEASPMAKRLKTEPSDTQKNLVPPDSACEEGEVTLAQLAEIFQKKKPAEKKPDNVDIFSRTDVILDTSLIVKIKKEPDDCVVKDQTESNKDEPVTSCGGPEKELGIPAKVKAEKISQDE